MAGRSAQEAFYMDILAAGRSKAVGSASPGHPYGAHSALGLECCRGGMPGRMPVPAFQRAEGSPARAAEEGAFQLPAAFLAMGEERQGSGWHVFHTSSLSKTRAGL